MALRAQDLLYIHSHLKSRKKVKLSGAPITQLYKCIIKIVVIQCKARFFLLVDLREFFVQSRVGGTKKINKKALKMTGHFQSFFFFFFFFFFNISRKKQ